MAFSFLSSLGAPRIRQNDVTYGPAPDFGSGLDASGGFQPDNQQPDRPSFMQAFRGGINQYGGPGRNPVLAGLAGQAGRGGFLGGLGRIASFLV
jgi:hypothetical protein